MRIGRPARRSASLSLALVAAIVGLSGCASGGKQVVRDRVSGETWSPSGARVPGAATLRLPGAREAQLVHYEVVDGMAVMEGDILLGPPEGLASRYATTGARGGEVFSAVAKTDASHLWPNGEIPYTVDASVAGKSLRDVQWALSQLATTELKLRPALPTDKDYVVFRDNRSGCNSFVGRIGGPQTINIEDGCDGPSVLHEILHASGFHHEHSRGDRDAHVTIVWENIDRSHWGNFDKRENAAEDIGAYDYRSLMHYGPKAFSMNGGPTIVSKGDSIGQREGLSAGDRAGLTRLYGAGGGVSLPGGIGAGAWPFPIPTELSTGGWPFPIPAGLPTSFPASLPAGFPTSLPLPTALPTDLAWPASLPAWPN